MMDELAIRRRQMAAFLEANFHDVQLTRYVRVSDGAGGVKDTSEQPLPAQRFRIVSTGRQIASTRRTIEGEIIAIDASLIGSWDADVERGDRLVWDGGLYEVIFINVDRRDSTVADLVYRGKSDA